MDPQPLFNLRLSAFSRASSFDAGKKANRRRLHCGRLSVGAVRPGRIDIDVRSAVSAPSRTATGIGNDLERPDPRHRTAIRTPEFAGDVWSKHPRRNHRRNKDRFWLLVQRRNYDRPLFQGGHCENASFRRLCRWQAPRFRCLKRDKPFWGIGLSPTSFAKSIAVHQILMHGSSLRDGGCTVEDAP